MLRFKGLCASSRNKGAGLRVRTRLQGHDIESPFRPFRSPFREEPHKEDQETEHKVRDNTKEERGEQ